MLMMMCDDEVWPSCRQGVIDGIGNVLSGDVEMSLCTKKIKKCSRKRMMKNNMI
jgi:hypothetical protein